MNRAALFLRHLRDMYRYYTRWLPNVRHDTEVFTSGYRVVPEMLSAEERGFAMTLTGRCILNCPMMPKRERILWRGAKPVISMTSMCFT